MCQTHQWPNHLWMSSFCFYSLNFLLQTNTCHYFTQCQCSCKSIFCATNLSFYTFSVFRLILSQIHHSVYPTCCILFSHPTCPSSPTCHSDLCSLATIYSTISHNAYRPFPPVTYALWDLCSIAFVTFCDLCQKCDYGWLHLHAGRSPYVS